MTSSKKLPDITNGHVEPVHAVYPIPPDTTPGGNPLELALPAIKSDAEWLEQLAVLPAFDEAELQEEAYIRSYHVARLKTFFLPAERGRHVARRFDQLLRLGLASRNPLRSEHYRLLQSDYARAQRTGKAAKLVFSKPSPICSFSLIGVSGMGKSTTSEAVLGAYGMAFIYRSRSRTSDFGCSPARCAAVWRSLWPATFACKGCLAKDYHSPGKRACTSIPDGEADVR